jgi:serine/threonine protein kinase
MTSPEVPSPSTADPTAAPSAREMRALARVAFGGTIGAVLEAQQTLRAEAVDALLIDLDDPADRQLGDYELLELLGKGSMGVVYRARQKSLDRDVAVKLLIDGLWEDAESVQRFAREARAAARMQHPNIVEIYEIGQRDGLHYFSMRLVQGPTLLEHLQRTHCLKPRDAAALMRQAAEAVDYAHRLGVLHLDLKPGNILLDKDGQPVIADFGLTHHVDSSDAGDSFEVSGTPSYMAPEQAIATSHRIGRGADVYGLGATLYEALTGRPPFLEATLAKTLESVISVAPPSTRKSSKAIPLDLDAICLKCLEKDPKDRYVSARELADDLGRFLEGAQTAARQLSPLQRLFRWIDRRPHSAGLTMGLIAALVVAAVVSHRNYQESSEALKLAAELIDDDAKFLGANDRGDIVNDWIARSSTDSQDQVLRAERLVEALRTTGKSQAAKYLERYITRRSHSLVPWILRVEEAVRKASYSNARELAGLVAINLTLPEAKILERSELVDGLIQELAKAATTESELQFAVKACNFRLSNACFDTSVHDRLIALDRSNGANWRYAFAVPGLSAEQKNRLLNGMAESGLWRELDADVYFIVRDVLTVGAESAGFADAGAYLFTYEEGELIRHAAADIYSNMGILGTDLLLDACGSSLRKPAPVLNPTRREVCEKIGVAMSAPDGRSMLAATTGALIVHRLLPMTEAEEKVRATRRIWIYAVESGGIARTRAPDSSDLYFRDALDSGELEAVLRSLERSGIPRDPPLDWVPEHPNWLLFSDERED